MLSIEVALSHVGAQAVEYDEPNFRFLQLIC